MYTGSTYIIYRILLNLTFCFETADVLHMEQSILSNEIAQE